MSANTRMCWIHALTPLHVGVGRGIGFIDLPIMREKVTQWPLVPGSAIKGVLADHFGATEEARDKEDEKGRLLRAAFGRADPKGEKKESANSGSLVFTDARLVCLPVRSLYGTFAWVTSPLVLKRLKRDIETTIKVKELPSLEDIEAEQLQIPDEDSSVIFDKESKKSYFEDLDFITKSDEKTKIWAEHLAEWIFPNDELWQNEFKKRFAVLSDDTFNFLCEMGTEVQAHVRIAPDKKTVQSGALWYEEFLPAETILGGLVWSEQVFPKNGATSTQLIEQYCSKDLKLQIGGKATAGKGQVQFVFSDGGQ